MSKLNQSLEWIVRQSQNLAAIFLAVAAALVFYQVFTRFVLGQSAVWSEVLARAVIVWGVFLVLGPAIRFGRMIPIDVIRSLFPPEKQIWIVRLVSIAMTIFLLILIWFGYQMTLRVAHQEAAMLNLSVSWFYAAIPVGALLAMPAVWLAHRDAEMDLTKHEDLVR